MSAYWIYHRWCVVPMYYPSPAVWLLCRTICSWRQMIIWSVFGKFDVSTPHCVRRCWFHMEMLGKMVVLTGCWWEVQNAGVWKGKVSKMLSEYLGWCSSCWSGRKGNACSLFIQQRDWWSHVRKGFKSAPPCDYLIEFQIYLSYSSLQKAGVRAVCSWGPVQRAGMGLGAGLLPGWRAWIHVVCVSERTRAFPCLGPGTSKK